MYDRIGAEVTRINNICRFEGCASWDDLARMSDMELMRIPNFGRKSLALLRSRVAPLSFYFWLGADAAGE